MLTSVRCSANRGGKLGVWTLFRGTLRVSAPFAANNGKFARESQQNFNGNLFNQQEKQKLIKCDNQMLHARLKIYVGKS